MCQAGEGKEGLHGQDLRKSPTQGESSLLPGGALCCKLHP